MTLDPFERQREFDLAWLWFLLAWLACLCICAHGSETVKDGQWGDASTWDVPPTKDGLATVKHAVTVNDVCGAGAKAGRCDVVAGGKLTIAGTIDLWGSLGGKGTIEGTRGEIRFHVADDRVSAGAGPDPTMVDYKPGDVGLWGLGEVHLKGPEVTSWVYAVPQTAEPTPLLYGCVLRVAIAGGAAQLDPVPVGWEVGDQLILTAVDGRSQLAKLTAILGDLINFDAPDFVSPALQNGDRIVYPKIGNLTRRFVISAADVTPAEPWHKAHVMAMMGGCVELDHVEFRNLGPRGKLGRYPVHYHKMGYSPCCYVNGCSMWGEVEPGNRFISVHDTSGVRVSNNIGYNSRGHGFFSETGLEDRNEWTGNLSINVFGREEVTPIANSVNKFGAAIVGATNTGNASTSHFWLRSGSKQNGNVAVGGTAEYGLILLPTKIKGAPALEPLSKWECHGINGWSYWFGVSGVELIDTISTYAHISATNTPIAFMPPAQWGLPSGLKMTNPTLLLNGNATPTDPDRFYQSALFVNNQRGLVCNGGLIAGPTGIAVHYDSAIEFTGTTFQCGILMDPTYWEFDGSMSDCELTISNRLFFGTYPKRSRFGVLTIQHSTGTIGGKSVNGKFTHRTTEVPGEPEPTNSKRILE